MQQRGGRRRQNAHGAQHDQHAVEAHDKTVVGAGAVLQTVGDGFQGHQFPQAVGGNRNVRDLARNGGAVTDRNADISSRQGPGNR